MGMVVGGGGTSGLREIVTFVQACSWTKKHIEMESANAVQKEASSAFMQDYFLQTIFPPKRLNNSSYYANTADETHGNIFISHQNNALTSSLQCPVSGSATGGGKRRKKWLILPLLELHYHTCQHALGYLDILTCQSPG